MLVRPRTPADEPAVARLLTETAARVEAADPRVRTARRMLPGGGALVAVDGAGAVRGHVRPVVRQLAADDEARQYAPDRSVSWADAAGSAEAIAALAAALRQPGTAGAAADSALWPSADEVGAAGWVAAGLEPVALYTLRPPEPLPAVPAPGVTVRPATALDVHAVAALHRDAIAFQAEASPYVRVAPAAEAGFRRRLADGSTTTHVLEHAGELLGVAEWWLVTAGAATTGAEEGRAAMLPPGRYAYLNSVGIRAGARGRGLGRVLVSAVLRAAGPGLSGTTLWFAAHNPVASRVWPHLGWHPLWTVWERRSTHAGMS
ncbi:MAG TPA: GNAT family N-acetyltransferase [Mycobacteriales bacterium]|nr:GNAT family N-acetyltransferase [Mycobacteriales bacterium]